MEMIYRIYHGKSYGEYEGVDGERQAGCVIRENQSDKDIIADLVSSDFLSQWNEYEIEDNICTLFIYHTINKKRGAIALVLTYEEDIEPYETLKQVQA